jgi:3-methyl-2-oxobutanoate hydroxymethyltransferase
MSSHPPEQAPAKSAPIRRLEVRHFHKGGGPYVWLTAYTAPIARLLDPHADVLLVGDSLGNVVYGLPTTLAVTLEMMVAHGQAVMRASQRACVVVDMPFGSYQESREQAFRNAARVMAETGCNAVKLEGGAVMEDTIRYLVERGIPVCAHVGLTPQSVQASGWRAQGRDAAQIEALRRDAEAIGRSGAFAVVIEATIESVAREIAEIMPMPSIGIGASAQCDGQVLVCDDMLGLTVGGTAKFVRKFADLAPQVSAAAALYAEEVRARRYPGEREVYG